MVDQLTRANINLYALLRNLEDLLEMDEEERVLAGGSDTSILFSVRDGPKGLLSFSGGRCSFKRGPSPSNIKLYFKSPQHFNDMIDGKANPLPLKGFTRLGFLKNQFTKLTDKLTWYLKPSDALLKDPKYFKINAYLTFYTAFYALAEIANTDRLGRMNASRISDGTISISVFQGPAVHLDVKNGRIDIFKGMVDNPRACMAFDSLETAGGILNGKLDSYSCIGLGKLQVKGFMPMIDNMNKILSMVPFYLK